uniref:Reverse transcriptase domain-containing protein n=1 Tax=Tanacetum cinerariifolium TaxID=118510 RepID=A0A699JQ57_TANCI|nr:hypothetical protein [Tanacetum cinerariifolium]
MHFSKASPFGLVSMYRKNRDRHYEYCPVASIGGRSLEPAAIIMPPKRTSTSKAPVMTQAAIRELVVDSVATALETQAATMANADNANRNPKP